MDIFKFLPVLFSLLSRGDQIAGIVSSIIGLVQQLLGVVSPEATTSPALDAKWVQTQLKHFGFDPGKIDGDFGPLTKIAVMAYQASRGIEVDGWVGPETLGQLLKDLAQ